MKIKRITAPSTWLIQRKHGHFVTDPKGTKRSDSLSLDSSLKTLGICVTTREAKKLISGGRILVNARKASSHRMGVGLFDVITVLGEEKSWRLVYNESRKLSFIPCKDADRKVVRIEGKRVLKGGKDSQLNLSGGINIVSGKKGLNSGDSLVISLPDLKVLDHLKPAKGSLVYVVSGSHRGALAKLSSIKKIASAEPDVFTLKTKDGEFNTRKTSVFVVGSDKEAVQLS